MNCSKIKYYVFCCMFIQSNNYLINPLFNPFLKDNYYIFEYGSVPIETRIKFKNRILKRKGAGYQKNIILIEELEKILASGGVSNFNEIIIKQLGCSRRMYDCHKSRLLKQLRTYYFNWEEREGENVSDKINRMFKCGMLKEAKNEILKIVNKPGKKKMRVNDNAALFDFCEKLFYYFSHNNEIRKSSYYFKQAEIINSKIIRSGADKILKSGIRLRFLLLKSFKLTINRFKINNLKKAAVILEKIKVNHFELLSTEQKLKVHHRLGLLYNVFKERERSIKEFKAAKILAEENSFIADALIFESFIMLRKFAENNNLAAEFLEFHKNNYLKIIKCHTDISQIMDYELNYLRFLIYSGDKDTGKFTADYMNRQLLYSRKSDALNSWYLDLSDEVSSNIAKWKITGNKFYISPDKQILDAFIKMNSESFYRFKNIYLPNVLSILYINIAEQEFWRSVNADFLKADLILKKLNRIIKLHNINISISWIETIKLGLEIFEALRSFTKDKVLIKFAGKTGKLTEMLAGKQQTFNISSDFAKLLFIKQEVNHPGFDTLINNFENKIMKLHPEQFEVIKRLANSSSA